MYIALEGIVGSGKTTQVQRLVDHLRSIWEQITSVREPGSTLIAEEIRYLAQGKEWEDEVMHPLTNAYLYAAARAQMLQGVVRPLLDRGESIVSDRSIISSLVIQGAAQGLGIDRVLRLNTEAIDMLLPDIIFYLDIDIDLALSRTFDHGGDKFERSGRDFYARAIEWYAQSRNLPMFSSRFITIDANRSEDAVFQDILSHLS